MGPEHSTVPCMGIVQSGASTVDSVPPGGNSAYGILSYLVGGDIVRDECGMVEQEGNQQQQHKEQEEEEGRGSGVPVEHPLQRREGRRRNTRVRREMKCIRKEMNRRILQIAAQGNVHHNDTVITSPP